MALQVAYLINQYPTVSHTFIRREIHALERRGIGVTRIALRGWDLPLVDEADRAERQRTRYVLAGGAWHLALAAAREAVRAPMRLARALKLAVAMSRSSERGLLYHLAYVAEACVIRRWIDDAGATHLHAHFASNPAEVAMLTHVLGGVPYSFTAHGSDIMDRPAQMGLPRTVGHAAFVAAVCSFGRSQLFKWIPHALWDRVKLVRCGLDPAYGRSATPIDGDSRRIVCVGRLSKEKGQPLLLHAAAALAAQGQAFELVLAGDGPLRGELEGLAQRLGIGERVRITGWVDAAAVAQELNASRALVLSSLSEGLPMVVMESMAQGRPVIAPFLAGIPELVDASTGWLYPAGDVQALAAAMRECLATPNDTLDAMGARGRAKVDRLHNIDHEAAVLGSLFAANANQDDAVTTGDGCAAPR